MPNTTPKPPVLSRKTAVGLQRERYVNRLLLIGTIAIVVLVVVLVASTWALDAIIYPNQTVAVVEGEAIKGQEFMDRARYNRQQVLTSYQQTYLEYEQFAPLFGNDPTFTQSYTNVFAQLQSQLNPEVSGQIAVDQLVNERLLDLEAAEMGLTVSADEVDAEIKDLFGYFPNGTPTPVPVFTTAPTSTLSSQQYALVSATPTASVTSTASATPTATETIAGAATQTLQPSATSTIAIAPVGSPTATLTPTEYTQAGFEQASTDFFAYYERYVKVNEAAIREIIRASLLREKVKDVLTADLPRTQEQVWARHILVATEEEALAVLERLNAGEDFASIAAEVSLDGSAAAGGDLGWIARTAVVEPFGNAAFELRIGGISEPVESEFGWHIIQVLGHEDRPLTSAQYEELRNRTLEEFILSLRSKYEYTIYEDAWKAMTPDEPDLQ